MKYFPERSHLEANREEVGEVVLVAFDVNHHRQPVLVARSAVQHTVLPGRRGDTTLHNASRNARVIAVNSGERYAVIHTGNSPVFRSSAINIYT